MGYKKFFARPLLWKRRGAFRRSFLALLACLAAAELPPVAQTQTPAVDLLAFFCPDCVGESVAGQRSLVGSECFYTYRATVRGRNGFQIVKSCDDPRVFEEFSYDGEFIYHLTDTSWATFQNGQWTNARCYDGREANSTYLNGAFGTQNGPCSGFTSNLASEGGIWVPRSMSVGEAYAHPVTVVAQAKSDCQCCQAQYTGPTYRTVKLVSRQSIDLGSGLGVRDVARVAILDGPGRGENYWYARGLGWIGFAHVEPPDGARSLLDVTRVRGVDGLGRPAQSTCSLGPPPTATPSVTGGLVLAHGGGSTTSAPSGSLYISAPVEPGQAREAEHYWGLRGIDGAGAKAGSCDTGRGYLFGWHQGDLAEYLVRFAPGYRTLNVIGLPDDPRPVRVNVYVDGRLAGAIEWNESNPGCNVSEVGVAQKITVSGIADGVHAVAFEFANDAHTCNGVYSDACDRNFWLDYFRLESDAGAPPPSDPPPDPPAPAAVALAWSSDGFDEFVFQSGFGQIPRGWSPWFENPNPASPGSREWNIFPGESGWAQEFRKTNVRIGLYRANSGFVAGQTYLLKLRAKWLSGPASPPLLYLGIHPTGASAPNEVTWSPGLPVASKTSWSTLSGEFTVQNANAAIFIKVDFAGLSDYGVAIDNLSIQPVGGSGNQPPKVTLATDRTTATAPGSFALSASASDGDGTISRVEFYQGSNLLGTDTTGPYSYTWSGVPAGVYALTARAYDNANAVTVSNAVSVVVNASSSTKSKLTLHSGWGG